MAETFRALQHISIFNDLPHTLSAASAEAGLFSDAIKCQEKSLEDPGFQNMYDRFSGRIILFHELRDY